MSGKFHWKYILAILRHYITLGQFQVNYYQVNSLGYKVSLIGMTVEKKNTHKQFTCRIVWQHEFINIIKLNAKCG